MTIRAHGAGAKLIAGCLFAIAAILTTTGLTVANSNASPSSCATGTPTASASPSPSTSPTSTPSPSASPGQVTLCETVSYKGSSGVSPGSKPPFSIEVSTQGGSADIVTVTLNASPSGVTPRFTNCPPPPANVKNTATSCTIGSLDGTQTFLAALDVPANASNGETVSLGAQAKAANPNLKVTQWASATVVKSTTGNKGTGTTGGNSGKGTSGNSTSGGGTSGSGTQGGGGAGSPSASAVAAGTGNPLAYSAGPLRKFLPMINGGSPKTGGNISAQLPSIPPAGTLPTARPAGYRASPSGPLSRQMLGTQLLALAALCAAVGIVLMKFWRRKPNPALAAGAAAAAGTAGGSAAAGSAPAGAEPGRGGWRRLLPWHAARH